MKILPNGYFSVDYTTEALSKGLRPTFRLPRNNLFLTKCNGAVGQDGVLSTLPDMALHTLLTSVAVMDDFPFPQVFVLEGHVLLCNRASIYELNKAGDAMVEKISGLSQGAKWAVGSSHDFIYLSNGAVSVVRDPQTGAYAINSSVPKTNVICNYNGQLVIGFSR